MIQDHLERKDVFCSTILADSAVPTVVENVSKKSHLKMRLYIVKTM